MAWWQEGRPWLRISLVSIALLTLGGLGGPSLRAQDATEYHQGTSDPYRDASSRICLECHDGSVAQNILGPSTSSTTWVFCRTESPPFSHPIGIDYLSFLAQSLGRLNPIGSALRLEEGKIGCITCHDLASSFPAKLAMSNDRSALCFTCHNL